MNPAAEQRLRTEFPDVYDVAPSDVSNPTFAEYGFECGEGWISILEAFAESIDGQRIQIHQIKEKFGGLRIYYDGDAEHIAGAADLAHRLSYKMCELCGAPGELRQRAYLRVRCDDCYKERSTDGQEHAPSVWTITKDDSKRPVESIDDGGRVR